MRGRLLAALILPIILPGQTPAQRPAFNSFEVASIKRTPDDWTGGRWMRMQTARQFVARGYQMRVLIAAAYDLPPSAVSGGPGWIDHDLYDVLAEVDGDLRPTRDEQMSMLRKLISDRFGLQFHREPKDFPVYALSVAKGGPKIRESQPLTSPEGPPLLAFVVSPDMIRLPARSATIPEIVAIFQRTAFDRPVIDKTGLTGRYDFDLEFTPDESLFGGVFKPSNNDEPSRPPGLFAAMQDQLGLRFDATRAPISAMVIDSIERPSDN